MSERVNIDSYYVRASCWLGLKFFFFISNFFFLSRVIEISWLEMPSEPYTVHCTMLCIVCMQVNRGTADYFFLCWIRKLQYINYTMTWSGFFLIRGKGVKNLSSLYFCFHRTCTSALTATRSSRHSSLNFLSPDSSRLRRSSSPKCDKVEKTKENNNGSVSNSGDWR